MGYILYNNLIDGATFTLTELSGTSTPTNEITNLKTRSPIENYILTGGGLGAQYRITVTFTSTIDSWGVGLLGFRNLNPTINLWTGSHGSGAVTYSATETQKTRYIDGETYTDYLKIFDEQETFKTLTFDMSLDLGTDYLGSIYIGEKLIDINFKHNAKISPTSTAIKDRSLGGQVYSNIGISYDILTISSVATDSTVSLTDVKDLNIVSQTSEPIILSIEDQDDMFFYGTQKKQATSTPEKKINNSRWMWSNSFNIEEEL